MNIGILGAGNIAGCMAQTVLPMEDVCLYAVASRSEEKAKAFAQTYHVENYYGSYEEMLQDEKIDLVYIATPHSHHFVHGKMCIEYGKPALVEKAFTRNAQEARELLAMAEEKGIFMTEAIWTRYMPSRKMLTDIIDSGIIGTVQSLSADLSYPISDKERIIRPELAGGALLDIGIYPLTLMVMVMGKEWESVDGKSVLSQTGVDLADSITVTYKDGRTAMLHSDARAAGSRQACIYGEKGYILIDNINNPLKLWVYNADHELVQEHCVPKQITGYEYEVYACREALEKGQLQCMEMPHEETIEMMELMDDIRRQFGVIYPGEEK